MLWSTSPQEQTYIESQPAWIDLKLLRPTCTPKHKRIPLLYTIFLMVLFSLTSLMYTLNLNAIHILQSKRLISLNCQMTSIFILSVGREKNTVGGYLRSECQLNDKLGLRTIVSVAFRKSAWKITLNTAPLLTWFTMAFSTQLKKVVNVSTVKIISNKHA